MGMLLIIEVARNGISGFRVWLARLSLAPGAQRGRDVPYLSAPPAFTKGTV